MSRIRAKKEGGKKAVIFKTSALVYIPFAILIIALLVSLFVKYVGKLL